MDSQELSTVETDSDAAGEVQRMNALRTRWTEMNEQAEILRASMKKRAETAGLKLDAGFGTFFDRFLQFDGAVDGADELERRLDGASRSLAGFMLETFVRPAGGGDPLENPQYVQAVTGMVGDMASHEHFRQPASQLLLDISGDTRPHVKMAARSALTPHDPEAVAQAYIAEEQEQVSAARAESAQAARGLTEDPNWKLAGGLPRG